MSFNKKYFLKVIMFQYLHALKSNAQDRIPVILCTNVTFRQGIIALTLIWVGFLWFCLEVAGGGGG